MIKPAGNDSQSVRSEGRQERLMRKKKNLWDFAIGRMRVSKLNMVPRLRAGVMGRIVLLIPICLLYMSL